MDSFEKIFFHRRGLGTQLLQNITEDFQLLILNGVNHYVAQIPRKQRKHILCGTIQRYNQFIRYDIFLILHTDQNTEETQNTVGTLL